MAPVIDLTSSPEPEERNNSNENARSALDTFAPRKQKGLEKRSTVANEDGVSPGKAARVVLHEFQPRKQRDKTSAIIAHQSVETAQSSHASANNKRTLLVNGQNELRQSLGISSAPTNNWAQPTKQWVPPPAQNGSLASLLAHKVNSRPDPRANVLNDEKRLQPNTASPSTGIGHMARKALETNVSTRPGPSPRALQTPAVVPKKYIVIDLRDDDAITSSRSNIPLKTISEVPEIPPFKRRRLMPSVNKHPPQPSREDAAPVVSLASTKPKGHPQALTAASSSHAPPPASPAPGLFRWPAKIAPAPSGIQATSSESPKGSSNSSSDRETNSNRSQTTYDTTPQQQQQKTKDRVNTTEVQRGAPVRPDQSTKPSVANATVSAPQSLAQASDPFQLKGPRSRSGESYTAEEDELIIHVKEVLEWNWARITELFPNRSYASIQTRYAATLSRRPSAPPPPRRVEPRVTTEREPDSSTPEAPQVRPRRKRNQDAPVTTGFVTWADVDSAGPNELPAVRDKPSNDRTSTPQFQGDRAYPRTALRVLRQRELGISSRTIPEELKEHVFDDIGPLKYFQGTSGDVTCLAWAPNGTNFAAGSIAISDDRSMQYNRPCNLLYGDCDRSIVQELPEHHVPRPEITDQKNVNSLHSMRETQDPRLFMTVASVQFSPDGKTLYSAGGDEVVRAYATEGGCATLRYKLEHSASVDLLSVGNTGTLATACHDSADGSITVFRGSERVASLSPNRKHEQTSRPIYPSALRWGSAYQHAHLLLAGFSIDSADDERCLAGEACLWDIANEVQIPLTGLTRNVFDVAWNPIPSRGSSVFAVASVPGSEKGRTTRSVIQCFAPDQGRARAKRVIEWECPAFDINDVLYCQHDENLIATGATDGKVYVWDKRFADARQTPLHVLHHGDSLNILDHDRSREMADTGVRFISWGSTSSRLFSGSSDGVVKVWNPSRSPEDAYIKDVAKFSSAVMSGAFSPDYCELLIGEDQGRINQLSVGHEDKAVRAMRRFDLQSAPVPSRQDTPDLPFVAAREMLDRGEIVLRPLGDLPLRQAMQGPNYHGPIPTDHDIREAQHKLHRAQEKYRNAATAAPKAAQGNGPLRLDNETEQALLQANKRVRKAKVRVASMQKQVVDADAAVLRLKAEANQEHFQQRERRSRSAEPCRLECSYLPAALEDDEVVPDSGRSQARIPSKLRAIAAPVDTLNLTRETLHEADLTATCTSCAAPAKKPGNRSIKPVLCERCTNTRAGLAAFCGNCSSAISATADSKLCEKCNFGCFRCGSPAEMAIDGSTISCERCKLSWTAGVLGYQLQQKSSRALDRTVGEKLDSDERYEDDGFERVADAEREHYASLWQ